PIDDAGAKARRAADDDTGQHAGDLRDELRRLAGTDPFACRVASVEFDDVAADETHAIKRIRLSEKLGLDDIVKRDVVDEAAQLDRIDIGAARHAARAALALPISEDRGDGRIAERRDVLDARKGFLAKVVRRQ